MDEFSLGMDERTLRDIALQEDADMYEEHLALEDMMGRLPRKEKAMYAHRISTGTHSRGRWARFRLDPPLNLDGQPVEFVRVSGVDVPGTGPETFVFAEDDQGYRLAPYELPGSFRGEINIAKAVRNMGYVIRVED